MVKLVLVYISGDMEESLVCCSSILKELEPVPDLILTVCIEVLRLDIMALVA